MITEKENTTSFEQKITSALMRSAQLAREDAIKHGTGIVVRIDGKVVEITAEDLKKQFEKSNETRQSGSRPAGST